MCWWCCYCRSDGIDYVSASRRRQFDHRCEHHGHSWVHDRHAHRSILGENPCKHCCAIVRYAIITLHRYASKPNGANAARATVKILSPPPLSHRYVTSETLVVTALCRLHDLTLFPFLSAAKGSAIIGIGDSDRVEKSPKER